MNVDKKNRDDAKSDTEFVWVKGKQWPDRIRLEREANGRPYLEINQLPQFIKQVVNDQRQNRPAIKIRPAGSDANTDVAETLEGLVRHIEYDSNAAAAYDSAFEHAVTSGRGYWRICTEYDGDKSFDQKILVKRIPDPNTVKMDPDYQEPDASDIQYCFVDESVLKDDFEVRFPDAKPIDWDGAKTTTDEASWFDGADKVIIADYFRLVYTPRKLILLSDGTIAWKDDVPVDKLPSSITIIQERDGEDCQVEWYKIAGGQQILATYEWAGKYVPVIMCVGDEISVGGERIFTGLVRRARDTQVMYNFWQTSATEHVALAPKAPWLIAEGQIEGHEEVWQTANTKNHSHLPYKPTSLGGTPVPPPSRTEFAGIPGGIVEQANKCQQDLYAVMGIYPPSLGKESNEISGLALNYRQRQGDRGTFHYVDNLTRAVGHSGRVIIGLIPHIYDTKRVVALVAEDGTQTVETVNDTGPHPTDPAVIITDPKTDLTSGKYAVAVDVGPAYATRRMDAADSMMEFMKAVPEAAPFVGDLVAKSQDWPGHEDFAERMLVMAPPQVQQLVASKKNGPQDAGILQAQLMAAQGQLKQMQGGMEQLQQAAQQKIQELTQKVEGLQSQVYQAKAGAAQTKLSATKQVMDNNNDLEIQRLETADQVMQMHMDQQQQAFDQKMQVAELRLQAMDRIIAMAGIQLDAKVAEQQAKQLDQQVEA